jgi:Fe2+ or Zn2+ uptake regulation protein
MASRNLKSRLLKLLKKHHLLSATDILNKLSAEGQGFNKTSVYRALDQLIEEDLICQHYFNEPQAMFELRADHHTHLFCEVCGKIQSIECTYQHQPTKIKDFKVDHHHVTLIGHCQRCQESLNETIQ